MHTGEYDYLFKLLLIGDSGVGKVLTSLFYQQRPLTPKTVLLAPSIR